MTNLSTQIIQQLSAVSTAQAGKGVLANSAPADPALRVVVTQVNPTSVTLTNPANNKTISLPAKLISSSTPLSKGQSLALLPDPNKPNVVNLIGLSAPSRSQTNLDPSSALMAQVPPSLLNKQIQQTVSLSNKPVSDFLLQAALSALGKSPPALNQTLDGAIQRIVGNTVSIQLQNTPNLGQQVIKVTLPASVIAKLAIGDPVGVNLKAEAQGLKVTALTLPTNIAGVNLSSTNTSSAASTQNKVTVSQSGVVPAQVVLPKLLASLPVKGIPIPETLYASMPPSFKKVTNDLPLLANAPKNVVLSFNSVTPNVANIVLSVSNQLAAIPATQLQAIVRGGTGELPTQVPTRASDVFVKPNVNTPSVSAQIPLARGVSEANELIQTSKLDNNLAVEKGNNQTTASNTGLSSHVLRAELIGYLQNVKQLSSSKIEQVLKQVDGILNQLGKQQLQQSNPQTQSIRQLLEIFSDQNGLTPPLVDLIDKIKNQLPVQSGEGNRVNASINADTIRQLFAAPTQVPPLNAISPTAQSSFLSGLVTLLQVSLASRLQKQSNQQAAKLQQSMPDLVKSIVPNVVPAQSAKLMQDFNQYDTKHLLTSELSKLLSSHAHNKLVSAQSSLQGQDTFYYTLPNPFARNEHDVEILVKRETAEQENKKGESNRQSRWVLNMKFEVGQLGEMLVKSQLQESNIDLQVLTSTQALKERVLDYMPFLQKRLAELEIDLVSKNCQLGKVPNHLNPANYQLFETMV